ncbi:hypothetical protein QTP86_016827 [Hemibagrus guttatus]|nr:hypothetical protein QTP86_016827 [Hemibagrus guttatus]
MMKVIQSHPVLFACAAAYGKNLSATLVTLSCDSMADSIETLFTHKVVDEGDDVTLSCKHKSSATTNNYLHWYRQYPKSNPASLLYIHQNGDLCLNNPSRMSAKLHEDKQVDLIISSAAVSDSALYYCALRPQ